MTQFLTSLPPFAVLALVWALLMTYVQRRNANDSRVEQLEPQAESLEPRDGRSPKGAIHTYRDEDALEHKAPPSHIVLGGLMLGLLLVLPGVAITGFAKNFTLAERVEGAGALALF